MSRAWLPIVDAFSDGFYFCLEVIDGGFGGGADSAEGGTGEQSGLPLIPSGRAGQVALDRHAEQVHHFHLGSCSVGGSGGVGRVGCVGL